MSYKWVTIKGDDGDRSFKVSVGGEKFYVYDDSENSLGTASSMEDAISIIKSKYGKRVLHVDIGSEQSGCFPASTLVLTPSGWRRIADINAGDRVISFNRDQSVANISTATKRLDHSRAVLWEIYTSSSSKPVRCTAIHAFLTTRGWVRARQLRVGDELLGLKQDGCHSAYVTAVSESDCLEQVYNLITTGEHNFIADGFVVHNFAYFREIRALWHRVFIDPAWGVLAGELAR